MITKKMFAMHVINTYYKENGISRSNNESYDDLGKHIYSSSSLAVALEYMGVLSKDELKYSTNRGGIQILEVINGEPCILSTRELIDLLPETLDNNPLSANDALSFISDYADMFSANIDSNKSQSKWEGMRILINELIDHIKEVEGEEK